MTGKATISIHFVAAALNGVKSKDFDAGAILSHAGISPDLLKYSDARVTPQQYTALMQALWINLQDETLGLAEPRSKQGTFAMMCHTMIHSASLYPAVRRGIRFHNLVMDAFTLSLRREGDRATIALQENPAFLHDPDHFLSECILVIWHGLACWLIGKRIPLLEASFSYPPPPHWEEYPLIFCSPLIFNHSWTGITFQSHYLDSSIVQDERSLKEFLKNSPADLLVRPKQDHSISGKIRQILREPKQRTRFGAVLPDLEKISACLEMSPQTLRRRLRSEGCSYQTIKDNFRRDAAINYLSHPDLSINEIAYELGFSEPSAFHRAFRKWTGTTPGLYRQESTRRKTSSRSA